MGKFKFEKPIIWQKAADLGEVMHEVSKSFPDIEKFNLSSQIRRAADSIALNISKGSIGQSNPEQKEFIGYSIRSLAEVVTCLFKAERRNYIDNTAFEKLYNTAYGSMNIMVAFRKKIK